MAAGPFRRTGPSEPRGSSTGRATLFAGRVSRHVGSKPSSSSRTSKAASRARTPTATTLACRRDRQPGLLSALVRGSDVNVLVGPVGTAPPARRRRLGRFTSSPEDPPASKPPRGPGRHLPSDRAPHQSEGEVTAPPPPRMADQYAPPACRSATPRPVGSAAGCGPSAPAPWGEAVRPDPQPPR